MEKHAWVESFPGSITVCDRKGLIIEMNAASLEYFKDDGGAALLGADVLDCHPEPSRSKLDRMMEHQQANIYSVERDGRKKLVYQVPWYQEGEYAGFVELTLPLPEDMPHFIRDS
jgi:transcriptional regulator with PAS, ATPase and Fis domain